MSVLAYMPCGADGIIIRVEADIRRGIPGFDITGLAEGAVREARERVRAAFRNSGFAFPLDRVLINLAPAGLRKEGASLDLPIALSVMSAAGIAPAADNLLVMGELELSGRIRPVRGVLAAVAAGLAEGIDGFIIPMENAAEAAILAGARFTAAENLREAVHSLFIREETGSLPAPVIPEAAGAMADNASSGDFADVRGQGVYKRALEIAAAGGHNMLVFGPPGAGKTMLARRLPSIMAPLTGDEAVEVTRLYSLAGPLKNGAGTGYIDRLITHPPFRAPHHSASAEGILGGGRSPRPGEISLAHYGVLFLDEAPEYRVNVLQALREPLEDRVISIVRAEGPLRLPAEFQLLMAANSCPCGRLGIQNAAAGGGADESGYGAMSCFCSPEEICRYWRKFSGALLDRIEIRAAILPPKISEIDTYNEPEKNEGSGAIARRVLAAVEIQRWRFRGTGIRRNALIPSGKIETLCPMGERAKSAFHKAAARLGFSGRAYHGILRVARTIADLANSEVIEAEHILEAVQHRRLGEDPWDIMTAAPVSPPKQHL
ncbi:MAG: YifB family Mg chelatase-like AAA ATPase [Treponema sp.]|nr:YifB family Mg chelatase-like AAA ATPase [Treponema sp.]